MLIGLAISDVLLTFPSETIVGVIPLTVPLNVFIPAIVWSPDNAQKLLSAYDLFAICEAVVGVGTVLFVRFCAVDRSTRLLATNELIVSQFKSPLEFSSAVLDVPLFVKIEPILVIL